MLVKPLRILAVGAHPDDIEILCAGTLARYAAEGHLVTMAVFTAGDMGDLAIPPKELAALREAETRQAAAVLGSELIWAGVTDEMVFPDAPQRALMIDILRSADPDIILTHSPTDYHPDHRYVSQLVFDSYFQKGLPHLPGQKEKACRFGGASVYYFDHPGGVGFGPGDYVDITETMDLKRRMLRCHASQLRAMSDLAQTSLEDLIEIQGRFRGFAAGCRYAEGFSRLETFQRGLSRRILP